METISMSRKERQRLQVLAQVKAGKLTLQQASQVLGMSYRQVKRVWSRYLLEGDQGLVHRARGQASNHQARPGLREKVLAVYAEKYHDYGPTHRRRMPCGVRINFR